MAELKSFVLRQEAITLYRTFQRALREAPKELQEEVAGTVRREFELGRNFTELYDMKYALSTGREQLKRLQEMLAMTR